MYPTYIFNGRRHHHSFVWDKVERVVRGQGLTQTPTPSMHGQNPNCEPHTFKSLERVYLVNYEHLFSVRRTRMTNFILCCSTDSPFIPSSFVCAPHSLDEYHHHLTADSKNISEMFVFFFRIQLPTAGQNQGISNKNSATSAEKGWKIAVQYDVNVSIIHYLIP